MSLVSEPVNRREKERERVAKQFVPITCYRPQPVITNLHQIVQLYGYKQSRVYLANHVYFLSSLDPPAPPVHLDAQRGVNLFYLCYFRK